MENKQTGEPLLYIDQPTLERPEARMQNQYQGSAAKSVAQQQEKVKNKADISFKRRSITGQINYLLSGPEEVPAIQCEVVTKQNNYRGMVLDQNTEEIIMRVYGRAHQYIPKETIQKIKLIGF